MNIKHISYLLVLINLFFVVKELPLAIIEFFLVIIGSSLIVKKPSLRTSAKVIFVFLSMVVLKLNFKPFLVPEAGVSFMLFVSALKLWELDSENDHFNMFLILALTEGSLFLLTPTLLMFSIGFLKTAYFFYFILRLRNYNLVLLNLRRILMLTIPALVFSGFLFYTFPRFTQGFSSSGTPKFTFSGSSNNLDFKKLGPISLSTKTAFRVRGLAASPALYWRSNVLWTSNGEDWTTNDSHLISTKDISIPPPVAEYQIQLADNFNDYLPTLDGVSNIISSDKDFFAHAEGVFRLKSVVKKEIHYTVISNTKIPITKYSPMMEKKGTQLVSKFKKELALTILENSNISTVTDEQKLALVWKYFKNKKFEYSLSPPQYNSVENFIQNGKLGYCSHFAAAFVYMAKSVGIPSRFISGYQGGEYNPFDQSIIVRERDGHAWAEVYLATVGWQKIDPTAYVAPTRIEIGASGFNNQLDPAISFYYFKIPKSLFNFEFLNTASMWLDSVNYKFNESLMYFDKEQQLKSLQNLISEFLSIESLFVLSIIGPLFIIYMGYRYYSKEKLSKEEARYRKFIKKMKSLGLTKEAYETASAFAERCQQDQKISKKISDYINTELDFYISYFYRSL